MKRGFIFLAISILLLTGCAKDEPVTGYGDTRVHHAPIGGYTEVESDSIKKELTDRIVYKQPGDIGTLELWLDQIGEGEYLGTLIISKKFWEKGYEFVGLDTERHIEPLEHDGRNWLSVTVRALFKQGQNTFTYNDSALELMIPVTRDEKGKVALGEYYAKTYYASSANPQEELRELGYNRKTINLQTADVTHDGTEDYIRTVIWTPSGSEAKTTQEMLDNAGIGYVEVFDGRKDYDPENTVATPIWEQEFASARPGNVQVSLVHRDGKDYLLLSDMEALQGTFSFRYEVLSLDNLGREYIVEQESLHFDNHTQENQSLTTEQKQQLEAFKEHVSAWFEDAALVVAADISNREQIVSTPQMTYRPEDYYDIIWSEYLGGAQ